MTRHAGEVKNREEFRYRGQTFTRICLPDLPYVVRWQPSASAWFASWVQCHQNQIMVQEKETGAILSLDTDQEIEEEEA